MVSKPINIPLYSAGRYEDRDFKTRTGNPTDVHKDEDPGGAASGLPEAHSSVEGEPVCEGGALYDAPNRRKFGPHAGKQKGTHNSKKGHFVSRVYIP